jgi:hypothetical protein
MARLSAMINYDRSQVLDKGKNEGRQGIRAEIASIFRMPPQVSFHLSQFSMPHGKITPEECSAGDSLLQEQ